MKKTVIIIVLYCCLFFSFMLLLHFGGQTYTQIYSDKSQVIIEKKDRQSTAEFIDELYNLSINEDVPILHSLIRDSSSSKPVFDLYTTSAGENFLHVSMTEKPGQDGTYISTDYNDKSAAGYILSLPLFETFEIFDLNSLKDYQLNSSRFYVRLEDRDRFMSLLQSEGFIAYLPEEETIGNRSLTDRFLVMFFLSHLVLISGLTQYAFSKRKEIVIKKSNGYDNISCFTTSFSPVLKAICVVLVSVYLVLCVGVAIRYPLFVLLFIQKSILQYSAYIGILIFGSALLLFIIQLKKSVKEIRGFRPDRILYLTTLFIHFLVLVVSIIGITNAHRTVKEMEDMKKTYQNASYIADDYFTLSLNDGSSSFDRDDSLFVKSYELLKSIDKNYQMLIVDPGEYLWTPEYDAKDEASAASQTDNLTAAIEIWEHVAKERLGEDAHQSDDSDPHESENGSFETNTDTTVSRSEDEAGREDAVNDEMDLHSLTAVFYVNNNYFDIEEAYYADGTRISSDDFSNPYEMVYLLPDTIPQSITEKIQSFAKVYFYKTPHLFHAFSPFTADVNQGLIKDPIINIANDEYYWWYSEYIIGEQFVYIKSTGQDMYTELFPLIKACGLETIILEAPSVRFIFDTILSDYRSKVIVYVIFGLFNLLSFLLISYFEAAIYFDNNKRLLTIKTIHGYGYLAYRNEILIKIAEMILLFVVSIYFKAIIQYMLLAAAIDFFTFLIMVRRVEHDDMIRYLKEDF